MRHAQLFPLSKTRSPRRAAAALELALVLPLLMIIAVGCADFGRYLHVYIAVSNAARTAAEHGASHRMTPHTEPFLRAQMELILQEEMATLDDYQEDDLTNAIDVSYDGPLPLIEVEVDYTFRPMFNWPALPSEAALVRRVAIRQYR